MHELVDPAPRTDQADRVVFRVLGVRFADLAQVFVVHPGVCAAVGISATNTPRESAAFARSALSWAADAASTVQPAQGRPGCTPPEASLASGPSSPATAVDVIDWLTERAHVADVRTSVVYEHLRNDRIGPVSS